MSVEMPTLVGCGHCGITFRKDNNIVCPECDAWPGSLPNANAGELAAAALLASSLRLGMNVKIRYKSQDIDASLNTWTEAVVDFVRQPNEAIKYATVGLLLQAPVYGGGETRIYQLLPLVYSAGQFHSLFNDEYKLMA